MEVIYWWMPIAWVVLLIVVAGVVVLVRRRAKPDAASLPVAHTDRLTALPSYRRALSRYRTLIALVSIAAVALLVASVGLASRFATTEVVQPDLRNRDIVLCLDISGSMIDYDTKVLDVFSDLAQKFEGERLSLVVFNASAVTYFPLTSDAAYIRDQFARLQGEFAAGGDGYYAGTLIGNGSSLVGDGLASCATRFDSPGQERSRSVILVTDNLVAGEPIFTLPEAGKLAEDRGIRVYGINPGDQESKDYLAPLADEFKQVVTSTGGGYYSLADPGTIPQIVSEITAQQAALSRGPASLIRSDQPGPWVLAAFVALAGLFLVGWRLRR